jgi:hypothetical protein
MMTEAGFTEALTAKMHKNCVELMGKILECAIAKAHLDFPYEFVFEDKFPFTPVDLKKAISSLNNKFKNYTFSIVGNNTHGVPIIGIKENK